MGSVRALGGRRMTVNKGLSLREKCRLQAALGPRRGPGRQAQGQEAPFPPLGLCPSAAGRSSSGIRAAALQSGTEGAAGRARGGEDRVAWRGHHRPAPPSPWRRRPQRWWGGEQEGESVLVATQRSGDVRRLSLVPKVTGRAAGPGTICVCPQRGCGASRVWRS